MPTWRSRKLVRFAIGFPVGCLLIGWVAFAILERTNRAAYEGEVVALEKLGVSLEPPMYDASKDPLLLFERASDYLIGASPQRALMGTARTRTEFMAGISQSLDWIEQGSALGSPPPPSDDLIVGLDFDKSALISEVSKIALVKAVSEIESGHVVSGVHWLKVTRDVATKARNGGIIGDMSWAGMEGNLLRHLAALVPSLAKQSDLILLESFVEKDLYEPTSRNVLGYEIRLHLKLLRMSDEMPPISQFSNWRRAILMRQDWFYYRIRAGILRDARLFLEEQNANPSPLALSISLAVAREASVKRKLGDIGYFTGTFSAISATHFSGMASLAIRQRLALALIKLQRIKLQNGSLPSSLPQEPWAIDPMHDKPFAYTAFGPTIIYSTGLNGKDDGGRRSPKNGPEDDISLALPWARANTR